MNYQQERDEFIALITTEGLPVSHARTVLARANTLQRISELSCSSEWADRDRVPCLGWKDAKLCICSKAGARYDEPDTDHYTVPRIDRQEARIQRDLTAMLAKYGMTPDFQGDPRGCVFAIKVPSGKKNDFTSTRGICVPSKGLPASHWNRAA